MATKVYFTKVRGLATIVWDPANKRSLAEFDRQGLYCTDDQKVIKTLLAMGYKQVSPEQITNAGLMLPEAFAEMVARQPGRGYTATGERGETAQPTTVENTPDLFEPDYDQFPNGPPGDKGRTLIK